MFYRSAPGIPGRAIKIGELDGEQLKDEIRELVDSIIDDEQNEKTKSPLSSESFVIAIHGSWGTGKTTAAWALINYLRQEEKKKKNTVHVRHFNLLPFGNIHGSLNNMLHTIANKLWAEGLLDIRKEFGRMLIDATPQRDMNAEIELLGFKLKRKITLAKSSFDYKKDWQENSSISKNAAINW